MGDVPRVLIAYATAAGSTAGIAERIAAVLRRAGCQVVCRPAAADLELTGFDALVVGSAVHDMAWLPPAVDVLGRAATSGRPVWCFSVGGVAPRGRCTRALTRLEVRRVEQQFPAGFAARDHRLFGGVVELAGVPPWGRLFYVVTGGRAGDRRNWPAIDTWTARIATELAATSAPSPRKTANPS